MKLLKVGEGSICHECGLSDLRTIEFGEMYPYRDNSSVCASCLTKAITMMECNFAWAMHMGEQGEAFRRKSWPKFTHVRIANGEMGRKRLFIYRGSVEVVKSEDWKTRNEDILALDWELF